MVGRTNEKLEMHEKKGQKLPTTLAHGFSRSGDEDLLCARHDLSNSFPVCAVLVPGLHNVPGPMQGAIFEVRCLFNDIRLRDFIWSGPLMRFNSTDNSSTLSIII
jgi:hypothetical protein